MPRRWNARAISDELLMTPNPARFGISGFCPDRTREGLPAQPSPTWAGV